MRCCAKPKVSAEPQEAEEAEAAAPTETAEAPEQRLEIFSATTGELLATLTLPVHSLAKDVKAQLEVVLGIDPELQQLLADDALLPEDQPLVGPLKLVRLAPTYNQVRAHEEDPSCADHPNVATTQNGLAEALGEAGEVREEGDETSYQALNGSGAWGTRLY